jgi:LPXTG-motif cell wall-anchored protein
MAVVAVPGPSPDFDTGLVGFAMIAGAAFLAHRRRRS